MTTSYAEFDTYMFQSTPGSEEPGDAQDDGSTITVSGFQSTPGSEEPGDITTDDLPTGGTRFNPRPAPRSRATWGNVLFVALLRFQSTPGSEEPGDVKGAVLLSAP